MFTLTFTAYILSNNANVQFMSRGYTCFIPATKLEIVTSTNQIITFTSSGANLPYKGDDVVINYTTLGAVSPIGTVNGAPGSPGTNGFLFSSLIKPILVKAFLTTTSTTVSEYNLLPFQTLDSTQIISVLNGTKASITLPSQPEYQIFISFPVTLIDTFFGGTWNFTPGSNNDFYVAVPEYNDGTLQIPVHVVQGTRKNIFVVNQRTISSGIQQYLGTLPSFISTIPANTGPNSPITGLVINRSLGALTIDTLIVQETSGQYIEYTFTFLPKIQTTQSILYTAGQTFGNVLPSYGYDYNYNTPVAFTSMGATITAPTTVTAMYGEETITFNLLLYSGSSVQLPIYY